MKQDAGKVEIVTGLAGLAERYDVLLCDVWGVLHNGLALFPEASDALARFRAQGGTVILITNAPRPNSYVHAMLSGMGMQDNACNAIVSSGDITRNEIAIRNGQPVYHLGPERDLPVFAGFDAPLSSQEKASYIVCTGLFHDDHETPADYDASLTAMAERGLTMVCANPDLVVERGDKLLYCAGALATLYETKGGKAIYAGKPHRPVYEHALKLAAEIRQESIDKSRVLGLGDAIRTDIAGAAGAELDSVLITRGIHAEDLHTATGALNTDAVETWLEQQIVQPTLVMERLSW